MLLLAKLCSTLSNIYILSLINNRCNFSGIAHRIGIIIISARRKQNTSFNTTLHQTTRVPRHRQTGSLLPTYPPTPSTRGSISVKISSTRNKTPTHTKHANPHQHVCTLVCTVRPWPACCFLPTSQKNHKH